MIEKKFHVDKKEGINLYTTPTETLWALESESRKIITLVHCPALVLRRRSVAHGEEVDSSVT